MHRSNFNPRSLTGATHSALRAIIGITISIHAPLRERRRLVITTSFAYDFNPRSLTGATLPYAELDLLASFQSTLPYGSDVLQKRGTFRASRFQSTLPYGSDSCSFSPLWITTYFNPRSLTGATKCNPGI